MPLYFFNDDALNSEQMIDKSAKNLDLLPLDNHFKSGSNFYFNSKIL